MATSCLVPNVTLHAALHVDCDQTQPSADTSHLRVMQKSASKYGSGGSGVVSDSTASALSLADLSDEMTFGDFATKFTVETQGGTLPFYPAPRVAPRSETVESAVSVASGCGNNAPEYQTLSKNDLEKITQPRGMRASYQAAGHTGSFCSLYSSLEDFKAGVPNFVLKKYSQSEYEAYECMSKHGHELRPFVPECFGVMEKGKKGKQENYLRLSNLLKDFPKAPFLMDCKLGLRSFTEEEAKNTKLRSDLYKRLIALDPCFPSEEENKARACTKYRWMRFNDEFTGMSSRGFRIDGITSGEGKVAKKRLQEASSLQDIADVIMENFLAPLPCSSEHESQRLGSVASSASCSCLCKRRLEQQRQVVASVLKELQRLLELMQASSFVESHSIVGSSLLFAIDPEGWHARVFLIDFAKTTSIPSGTVTHNGTWLPGNHEDGIFLGMENMIRSWEILSQNLEAMSMNT
eukprot:TRINITY_DN51946_c0_g1_i1.p1 TRINITY_DN51946_c0_g1~~TRINITY_DN51946_c0_g1_i1.p1  ORF type:complete len:464 (+),score=98.30 TRINITY_DN51946_c0_g1_i1:67-1458(+)